MKYSNTAALILVICVLAWFFVQSRLSRRVRVAEPTKVHPANSELAAKRALCLAAVVQRANAEYQLHPAPGDLRSPAGAPPPDLDRRLNSWLKAEGLWDSASDIEKALMQKPLGAWTKPEVADGQWREDSLDVLIWALRSDATMPPYDVPIFTTEVMKSVRDLGQLQQFLARAKLRPEAAILKALDVAELWLWRSRTTQLQKEHYSPPKGERGLEQIVSMTVAKAQKDGLFTPIRDDFPALGKPYAELTESEWQTLHSIATERLYALNWLCGYAENWDDVPTGT